MAQEVQRGAFGRQDAARRPADDRDQIAWGKAAAVWTFDQDLDRRIDQAEGGDGIVEARNHAGLARHQGTFRSRAGGDDGVGRQITGTPEVFKQRRADGGLDHDGGEGSDHCSCSVCLPVCAHRIGLVSHRTASIRSTAWRARTATAGSIVTSWRISSSAVRILASVMRFMCGHRLQGRMNCTSG